MTTVNIPSITLDEVHGRGLAADRPAATAALAGYLYYSTDTQVLERCSGTAWENIGSSVDLSDYVETTDSRLTDARTPTAHAASHAAAGSDPLTLSPSQITGTAVVTSDSRLTDARTPTAHTHAQSEVTGLTAELAGKLTDPTTSKGDLIVRSSPTASISRLAVGINGQVLTADSTATLGVKWASASGSTYDALIGTYSGLVHRWKFEEASGNFADSVGSLTLTATGTFTYGVAGGPVSKSAGSVTFGASAKGQTSSLGSIPIGGAARTIIAIWKNNTTAKECVWSYGSPGAVRQNVSLIHNWSGTNQVGMLTWSDDLSLLAPVYEDAWHMTAFVYDGTTTWKVWHDGIWGIRNLGAVVNTVASANNFTVGYAYFDAGYKFNGSIDDIAVFNRALTNSEIMRLAAALSI